MHWAPGTGPSRHVVRSGERWVNTMCGLPWLGARFRWPSTMIHSCIGCSRPTHSSDGSTSRFAIPLTARRERTRTEDPGRHQAGCGPCQSRTMWSEAMAEALAAGYWNRDRRSCCGAPGRSADVPKSADPVSHPKNGGTHANQSPVDPEQCTRAISPESSAPTKPIATCCSSATKAAIHALGRDC